MDAITHTLIMWEDEALIVLITLLAVVLVHYATRLWSAPLDTVLLVILAASVGVVVACIFTAHSLFGIRLSTKALWFVAFYIWCVLGMMFVAARNTSRSKLVLGLMSQAGVLYTLFVFF